MEINSQPKRHWRLIIGGLIALFVVLAGLGLFVSSLGSSFSSLAAETTRATESALTVAHGAEARLAIQTFIDTNWSFAAFRNPQLLTEVATGQNLKALQALKLGWSSKTVDVLKTNTINKVQVIDYSPTQFKAFSCEVLNFDTVTLDRTYVSSVEPLTAFRIYVFSRENGVWKVIAWADFTDAEHITRDWTEGMYPQWDKDLIGDLPALINRYDTCVSS